MICWYCYWGVAKPVADIYSRAAVKLGYTDPLEFGPSHVVWSDENFDDDSIQFCIRECDTAGHYNADEIDVVRQSLVELLKIPKSIRECCPEEYDGCHPENYPPPDVVDMVKIDEVDIFPE